MGLVWIPIVEKVVDGKTERFFETPNFTRLTEFVRIFVVDDSGKERELSKFTEGFEIPQWKLDEDIKSCVILHITVSPYSYTDYVVVIAIRDNRADFLINNTLEQARKESESLRRFRLDKVKYV